MLRSVLQSTPLPKTHFHLCINTKEEYRTYTEKNGVYGGNVLTLDIGEIYRVCQCLFCTWQANHSSGLVGQVVTKRHWRERQRLTIFNKVCVKGNLCHKHFLSTGALYSVYYHSIKSSSFTQTFGKCPFRTFQVTEISYC
jgi:hypothetical protein